MRYEHSLTFAVQLQIDGCVAKQRARAHAELDRFQTAEELLGILTDPTKQITPGFVLRRHIQGQGVLVSREECADLSRTGNIPWPEEVTRRVARALSHASYERHGRLPISTANWERYLTDNITQGIQRDMIFKLAIVTGMGREETLELLMACGQGPYNVRRAEELILWFCQRVPGAYTWDGVERLLDAWARRCGAGGDDAPQAPPTPYVTQLLRQDVDRLLDSGSLVGGAAEQKLIETMAGYRAELTGFSPTAQERYRRLLDYLAALYLPGGQANPHRLIDAMYGAQGWFFDDLFQAPRGERYMFRGYLDGENAKIEVSLPLDRSLGDLAKFCKWYYKRANRILDRRPVEKGRKGGKLRPVVDRRDIMLLGYFLITGCMEAAPPAQAAFWTLTKAGGPVDRRMELLREDLDLLGETGEANTRQVLCRRILNELLAEFELPPFYSPCPFDQFVLFALLTDHPTWTARYLLGEDLED